MTERSGSDGIEFLAFVRTLSGALNRAVYPEAEGLVERGLASLVHLLDIDRASLIEVEPDTGAVLITHSWAQIGLPLAPGTNLRQVLPWYAQQIDEGRPTILHTRALPPEAVAERAYCRKHGFEAVATVPVPVGRHARAAISVGTFSSTTTWPPASVEHLRFVGEILLNVVLRDRAVSLSAGRPAPMSWGRAEDGVSGDGAETLSLDDAVRRHILHVLEVCDWRIKGPGGAAERLDVPPSTLRFRLGKLGIKRNNRA